MKTYTFEDWEIYKKRMGHPIKHKLWLRRNRNLIHFIKTVFMMLNVIIFVFLVSFILWLAIFKSLK